MNVIFEEDSKNKLIQGVNVISEAVKTTFGPNGKNVFIKGSAGLHVTKDGATVAEYVKDNDPFVSMGIDLIKKIATKTADDVGDGTTTSTILAQEIVNTLKNQSEHPIEISRKLQEDVKNVLDFLNTHKKEITIKEDLIRVATISANNDLELGKLIGEAYFTVGKDGIVYVEESTDIETSVNYTEGVVMESGYASPYFINNEKKECELEDVLLYISDYKISMPKQITEIANRAIRENKSLVIIAPKSDSSVIANLLNNINRGVLKSCLINPPSHGVYRELLLKDIKNNIGEYCDKVIVSFDKTIFINGTKDKEKCDIEISNIKKSLETGILGDFEKDLNTKRLANYLNGIATIFVGGFSAVEIKEKKDRVEDAICAVRAAFIGGVLPGGGIALAKSAYIPLWYLSDIIKTPYKLLRERANIKDESINLSDFWVDIDLKSKVQSDFYDLGILDPFLVTKVALENAVTAASLVLTSGCSII